MTWYSIKELERLSGIKAHTIRIWEKRYNIISPHRTSTNIRLYCDDDLKKLLNISILNKNGYKISKIASMSSDLIIDKILELYSGNIDSNNFIENLIISMIELNENKFEKVFSGIILRLGFEDAFINVIFPFLEKTGILWQTNKVKPVHEHFIGNLIRQKLIVAIDGIIDKTNSNSKFFVLFSPEDENFEIALLFHNYLVKKYGHNTTYLGKGIQINDLEEISKIINVDYFMSAFLFERSDSYDQMSFDKFFDKFEDIPLVFSSVNKSDNSEQLKFDNLIKMETLSEFSSFLKNL